MAQFSRLKKTIVIAAVGAVTIAGAGVAFAYWTSTGTGTGEAQTGEAAAFVFTVEDASGVPLTPGGPSQTVAFSVANPGPGTLYFGQVTVAMATSATTPWVPLNGCAIAAYTVSITTQPETFEGTVSGSLTAGQSAIGGVATVTMADNGLNQDTCQGQTVPLWFTANSTTYVPPT